MLKKSYYVKNVKLKFGKYHHREKDVNFKNKLLIQSVNKYVLSPYYRSSNSQGYKDITVKKTEKISLASWSLHSIRYEIANIRPFMTNKNSNFI